MLIRCMASSSNDRLNARRAKILLDALDDPEVNDIEFRKLAIGLLGPAAEDLPDT